jgi:hypothetical protein
VKKEMRFFKQLKESIFSSPITPFGKISGYADLKEIVKRALEAEENYNLLLVGRTLPYRIIICY